MAFSRVDRKIALLKTGWNNVKVADHLGVDRTLVSHVIAGRRWMGRDARKIMQFLAHRFGVPLVEAFPGSTRRKGEARRSAA